MNYLTAIVALPLFIAIWCFEVWLFMKGSCTDGHGTKLKLCMLVSTLQMISCWFWFFGFVFSKTNDVLSEAMGPDEEMNCFGLVGAEVLLACFQFIFTMVTISISLTMVRVSNNTGFNAVSFKHTKMEKIFLVGMVVLLIPYTLLAFVTARNRRCPQSEDFMIQFQHHFYPVYLIIDAIFAVRALVAVKKIELVATAGQGVNQSSNGKRSVTQFVKFFSLQAKVTVVGAALAVGIFVIQFMMDVEALSVIACAFCVMMYITYALRRVPIIAAWVGFDLSTRRFKKGYSRSGESTVTQHGGKSTSVVPSETIVAPPPQMEES